MGAELIPFTRAVVPPEAQAAAQRSLASGWPTTSPESSVHLMNHPDAGVQDTGMREGEKLDEALFSDHEQALPTAHPRIFWTVIEQRVVCLHQKPRSLYGAPSRSHAQAVKCDPRALLSNYLPQVPAVPAQVASAYADDY